MTAASARHAGSSLANRDLTLPRPVATCEWAFSITSKLPVSKFHRLDSQG
jgi:hypothetical protein